VTRRGWTLLALLVVVAAIGVIAFWPTPVDQPVAPQINDTLVRMHDAGMPRQVNYNFVEFGANVVMFLPFGALVALLLEPWGWWLSGVAGLTFSLCIELGQYLLPVQRFASPYDLASNTAGALVGAAAVAVGRGIRGKRRTRPSH
jgi:glycopeptide antibiotics resistance protein